MTSVTASHCSREPGKWNPPPGLATDRRVDGERHAHVHRVAERPADQRVRPVHRPGEAVALGSGEEHVLLHVVEVLVGQARLILRERRVRLSLGVRLERPEVVLEPGDERDVARRTPRAASASRRFWSMRPLTSQFSASVARRDHVVKKTCVGAVPRTAAETASASSRSAAQRRDPLVEIPSGCGSDR